MVHQRSASTVTQYTAPQYSCTCVVGELAMGWELWTGFIIDSEIAEDVILKRQLKVLHQVHIAIFGDIFKLH